MKIHLVRHGQSEGNVDRSVYSRVPDYAISLTAQGLEQARQAGKKLKELIGDKSDPLFFVSPFWRTRETYEMIAQEFPYADNLLIEHLTEQSWGQGSRDGMDFKEKLEQERMKYGIYYWRFPNGESVLDVELRVRNFLYYLDKEYSLHTKEPPANNNVVMVTHGMTMRVIAKIILGLQIEEFEEIKCPKNCEIWTFELQKDETWKFNGEFEKYPKTCHPWQYKTLLERGFL